MPKYRRKTRKNANRLIDASNCWKATSVRITERTFTALNNRLHRLRRVAILRPRVDHLRLLFRRRTISMTTSIWSETKRTSIIAIQRRSTRISTRNEKTLGAVVFKIQGKKIRATEAKGKFEQTNERHTVLRFRSPTDFDQTQSATFATHGNNAEGGYADTKHRTSLPVTVNLNPGPGSQTGALPATMTIPLGRERSSPSRQLTIGSLLLFLDSQVNRVGDKISVNIDLRLVDLQNLKQQQQQNPDWSGLDPLDRHIRKLERSIDQVRGLCDQGMSVQRLLTCAVQKSPQVQTKKKRIECRWINCICQRRRGQVAARKLLLLRRISCTARMLRTSFHRMSLLVTPADELSQPTQSDDAQSSGDDLHGSVRENDHRCWADGIRAPELWWWRWSLQLQWQRTWRRLVRFVFEGSPVDDGTCLDSYLAKMNHMKRGPNFKPYNGRDYEQFKKNYGFGGGNLGFDFDNPNYKEKVGRVSLSPLDIWSLWSLAVRVINCPRRKNTHNKSKHGTRRNSLMHLVVPSPTHVYQPKHLRRNE